jgi:hypothetical protein
MQNVTSRVFATTTLFTPVSPLLSPVNTAYSKLLQRARFPEADVRNMLCAQIAHFILKKTNILCFAQSETTVKQSAIFIHADLKKGISNILDDFYDS